MINNYRFGSYAILAMGLINLRYETGNSNNLNHSLVLILLGLIGLLATFIPKLNSFLANKFVKFIALILLAFAIAYGFLI
ncbi:MAG: hypothetical protein EBS18_03590 [Actinobacteria bacterium]|nr:hypothetical protein [Actinomycetota bacterium]